MMPLDRSKRHENPVLPLSKGIHPGLLLGNRYQIVRQLGHGGFACTYLAEDTKQLGQPCILKEFTPLLPQTAYDDLQKAEKLLEREADVLYKLQHPQLPHYRELFRVDLDGGGYLFLVQDYEPGQTYRSLLEARKHQGLQFSEVEVCQLLLQILPVLGYIHSMGVIYRDICPDNLILRSSDSLPVLIDAGINQVAATVTSQLCKSAASKPASPVNLLEKLSYSPYEQIQTGIVHPHSDLYALAATMLVLLTSKEPQELIDESTLTWNWQREVNLSPTLGAVLDKMLLPKPSQRYQSASQVLQALSGTPPAGYDAGTRREEDIETWGRGDAKRGKLSTSLRQSLPTTYEHSQTEPDAVSPTQPDDAAIVSPKSASNWPSTAGRILLVLLVVFGAGSLGWWFGNLLLQSRQSIRPQDKTSIATKTPGSTPTSQYPPQEEARRQVLFNRAKDLGINENFLFGNQGLVNQVFNRQHPAGTTTADWRSQWDKTADTLLDALEKHLSPEARRQLGSYTAESRDRAKTEVNKQHLSSRALYDLANATFSQFFPELRGQNFLNQPSGQVWQGLVADKVKAIQAGALVEQMTFSPRVMSKSVSNTLNPGEGKAYASYFAKAQSIKLNLRANPQVLISVYSPTGKTEILTDSSDRTWSGKLPEQGFYEFVVISTASEPVDYQLNVTVKSRTRLRRGVPTRRRRSPTTVVE